MSQENVEMVRQAIGAFNQRDLEAAARHNDPEVEVDWSRSMGVDAGIYRGPEAVRDFWSTFFELFELVTVSPEEFIQTGEHVVVPNRARFRGRDGVEVEAHSALVVTFRDRRIREWRLYQEKTEALEAVGLSE